MWKLEDVRGQKGPVVWKEILQRLLCYSQNTLKKSYFFSIWITSQSLFFTLPYWSLANELKTTFFTSRTTTDWPTGNLNPNNVLQAPRDRRQHLISIRSSADGYFLTATADENKGNCILKQRPSRNPHNSCCLWCKYFREVRWPHSVAKAINNHKKYEPPSPWLIACVLHNALFAVSFKQFTISPPNCQSNQGYFKVIFACVSLDTLQLSP